MHDAYALNRARLLELAVRGGQRFGNSFDVTPESRQWASGQAAFWISSSSAIRRISAACW